MSSSAEGLGLTERFIEAADLVGVAAWEYDPATDTTLPSRTFCELFGRSVPADRVSAEPFRERVPPEDVATVDRAFERAFREGRERVEFCHRLVGGPDGRTRWLRAEGKAVALPSGRRFVGTVVDVTAEKTTAERLALLNQEASHRIKNNLSLVVSMLSLEADAADRDATKDRFERVGERIRAIADVHDLVARTGGQEVIDFGDYLTALCRAAQRAVGRDGVEVAYPRAMVSVPLDVDRSISLALLTNELITNAVQHAFPDGRSGTVAVEASAAEGVLSVEIRDDGVGKTATFAGGNVGSMIVAAMAKQTGAVLTERAGRPGHVVRLRVPLVR